MKGLFLIYLSFTSCLALNPENSKFHNVFRRDVSEILNGTSGRHYDSHKFQQNVSPTSHSTSRSLSGRTLRIYEPDPTRSNLAPHPSRTYLPAAQEGYPTQRPGQEYIGQLFPGHSSSQSTSTYQLHKGQAGFHTGSLSQTGFSSAGFDSHRSSFPSNTIASSTHSPSHISQHSESRYGQQSSASRYGQPQQAYYHQITNPHQQLTGSGHNVHSSSSFSQGRQTYGQSSASNFNVGHLGTSDSSLQRYPFDNQLTSDSRFPRPQNTGFSSTAFHSSASQSSSGTGGIYHASSSGTGGIYQTSSSGTHDIKKDYDFGYGVAAQESGTEFHHEESRRDGRSKGKYEVLLPDGRRQVVEYEADDTGFWPKVTYQGKAHQDPLSTHNVNTVLTDLLNNDLKRTRDPKGYPFAASHTQTGGYPQYGGRESNYARNFPVASKHYSNAQYQDNSLDGFSAPGYQYQSSDQNLNKNFGDRSIGRSSDLLPPHTHGLHYSQPYAKNRPQVTEPLY